MTSIKFPSKAILTIDTTTPLQHVGWHAFNGWRKLKQWFFFLGKRRLNYWRPRLLNNKLLLHSTPILLIYIQTCRLNIKITILTLYYVYIIFVPTADPETCRHRVNHRPYTGLPIGTFTNNHSYTLCIKYYPRVIYVSN